jgi:outer membrane lipase/esterase
MSSHRPFHFSASLLACFAALAPALANAQAYTSIVIFGDSLCDTGNDATVSAALYTVNAQVPGPATGYTNGRFTDGLDTSPAARSYTGVWIEQLAAMLAAKPPILNSLAGGTNYAYGFATTDVGTSNFAYGPGNALSFNVNNMGLQLSTYLATNPTITNKTLFVVWGGANDLIAATTSAQIVAAATRDLGLVQTLVSAGATDILVVNLPPLGLVPRFNGSSATSLPATQAAAGFDQALAAGLAGLPAANPGKTLHLFSLDTYTLFNTIIGPPLFKGLANVTAMSQGNTAVNPDTFLFWDSLHPTTFGHSLIAAAALTAIGSGVSTKTTIASTNPSANLNAAVTFTASVATTSTTPMGTVTFYDGTTAVGSSLVFPSASATTATGTFTTSSLTAGTHTITASFAGVNGYTSSTATGVTETVTAPALTAGVLGPVSVFGGQPGVGTVTLNAVGGFTGTVTLACGTLPAHFSCTISPASITFPSSTTQANVTLGTNVATSLLKPPRMPGAQAMPGVFAALLFPGLGLLSFAVRRRRVTGTRGFKPLLLVTCFSLAAAFGLAGCGGSTARPANDATPGTYTVPIVVTANSVVSTVNLSVNVF